MVCQLSALKSLPAGKRVTKELETLRELAYNHLYTHWSTGWGVAAVVNAALGTSLPDAQDRENELRSELYGFYASFLYFTEWGISKSVQVILDLLTLPRRPRPSRQLIYSDIHSVLRRPLKNKTRLPAQSVLLKDKDKVHSVTKRGRKIDIVQVEFENDATVICFPVTILIKGSTILKTEVTDGRVTSQSCHQAS